MAISSAMVWEDETGGSDANNSGGFRGGAFISPPAAPTTTGASTGGTVAAGTYYNVITYTDGLGDTVISGETAVTVSGATSKITTTSPPAATGALTWNSYFATTSGGPYFPEGTSLTIGSNRVRTTTPPTTGTQPRGVDYSLSTTRQVIIDNSIITATTTGANSNTLTFTAGHTAVGVEVGNTARITNGTNINVGDYEITAITPTTWTLTGAQNLTTAGGAGSAIIGGMGGCHASPGQTAAFAVAGNSIYAKNGTYTIANGTNNTAGNKFSLAGINLIGYSTNRYPGNTDTKPVFDAGAASMTMCSISSNGMILENISFTNSAARASVTAISSSANQAYRIQNVNISACATPMTFSGFSGVLNNIYMTGCGGITGSASQFYNRCTSINATANAFGQGIAGNQYTECVVVNSAGTAFVLTSGGAVRNCIVNGTTSGGHGIGTTSNTGLIEGNIIYGCSGSGISTSGAINLLVYNTACGGNTGVDFDLNLQTYQKINTVSLPGDPFVNGAGLNFALGTNAAALLCKSTGIPGTLSGLSTTGYRDMGVFQHQDSSSGVSGGNMRGGFVNG